MKIREKKTIYDDLVDVDGKETFPYIHCLLTPDMLNKDVRQSVGKEILYSSMTGVTLIKGTYSTLNEPNSSQNHPSFHIAGIKYTQRTPTHVTYLVITGNQILPNDDTTSHTSHHITSHHITSHRTFSLLVSSARRGPKDKRREPTSSCLPPSPKRPQVVPLCPTSKGVPCSYPSSA